MIGQPSMSMDQHPYELVANIGSSRDLKHVIAHDAEGVGLFRTEFLFLTETLSPQRKNSL